MNFAPKLLLMLPLIVITACARQVISGGFSTGPGTTVYSSTPLAALPNFPGTGLGEKGVQMRMRGGTASTLRVTLTTGVPLGVGQLTATVRVNGVSTAVSCQLTGPGDCDSGATSVTLADNDRLDVMVSNSFSGPFTNLVVQWTLLYN